MGTRVGCGAGTPPDPSVACRLRHVLRHVLRHAHTAPHHCGVPADDPSVAACRLALCVLRAVWPSCLSRGPRHGSRQARALTRQTRIQPAQKRNRTARRTQQARVRVRVPACARTQTLAQLGAHQTGTPPASVRRRCAW
eukprot:7386399-Prymnesium_polylepis.3